MASERVGVTVSELGHCARRGAARSRLERGPVVAELARDVGHQRVVGVGRGESAGRTSAAGRRGWSAAAAAAAVGGARKGRTLTATSARGAAIPSTAQPTTCPARAGVRGGEKMQRRATGRKRRQPAPRVRFASHLENVHADAALVVDVGVVHLGAEGQVRRLPGVVCGARGRKKKGKKEQGESGVAAGRSGKALSLPAATHPPGTQCPG